MRTYLGEFELLLLMALLHDPESHGAQVRRIVEARTGRTVSPGAIYTALDRLERRGLVSSRLGDPTPQRGGKRKRHYRLEPAGVMSLERSREALDRMARGLQPRTETP